MEDGVNSRNLVIKVKYGDSLRRFSARVNGDSTDHDMSILRSKIISLFKFSTDADLVLQYTDVDGDLVTLETDEELYDAIVNQSLNPLRITIQLNHNTETRSESSATNRLFRAPADWSALQDQINTELSVLQDRINFNVKEALKTVPEPVQDALSNLSQDFLSKAAVSVPMFTGIAESLAKLGLSNHQHPTQVSSSRASGSQGDGAASDQSDLNMQNTSNSPVTPTDGLLLDAASVQKGNSDAKSSTIPSHLASLTDDGWLETHKKDLNQSNSCTESLPVPEVGQGISFQVNKLPVSGPCSTKSDTPMERSYNEQSASVLNMGSGENGQVNNPAIGSPLQTVTSDGSPWPFMPYGGRHFMHHTNFPPPVHHGVVCDGCGMSPIVGPRYKSNVKHDYDLCGFCFSKMGGNKDYARIDQPTYRPPRPAGGFYFNPQTYRGPRMRSLKAKLESRFVQDVTIMDGTLVAPCTPFIKIWRMHNNGAIPWPRGTLLIWIGGDKFSHRNFVELEVPENGFPVNTEVDIAVDCVAPSVPGRYMSYWRLATPSGQKFGQRVWVQIQVDNCHGATASAYEYQPEVDLNVYPHQNEQDLPLMVGAPFESNGEHSSKFPDFVDLNVEPTKHGVDRTQDDKSAETTLSRNFVVPVVTGGIPTSLYPRTDAPEPPLFTPETTTSNGSHPIVDPSSVPLAPQLPPLSVPKSIPPPPLSTPESVPPLVSVPMPSSAVSGVGSASPTTPENSLGKTIVVPPGSAETIPLLSFTPEFVSVLPLTAPPQSASVPSSPTLGTAAPLSSYPAIDPTPSSSTISPSASAPPSGPAPDIELELQVQVQVLLKELEGMGFKEVEVNKEMLRKNEYDLQKTIDDLCCVAEWDPLLNELREMGFWDEELNKKLLIKNDGSIKRVVLDLISGKTK